MNEWAVRVRCCRILVLLSPDPVRHVAPPPSDLLLSLCIVCARVQCVG